MAIALDTATNTAAGTGNLSWTHTGASSGVCGALVFVTGISSTDIVSTVTYGGVTMTQLTGSPNLLTTGELGAVSAWFLKNPAQGNQTVSITVTGSVSKRPVCITVKDTAATVTTWVNDVDATINSTSSANPSVTLSLNSQTSFCCIAFVSGQNAVSGISPLSSWTSQLEHDFGNQTAGYYTYDTIGSSDVSAGWTQTAEDAVAIAVALAENLFITAASATFAETDTAVTLKKTSLLSAASATYTEAASAVTLSKGFLISAGSAAFNESASTAALTKASLLTAGSATFSEAASTVALTKASLIAASSAAFDELTSTVGLTKTSLLAAGSAVFDASPSSVGLLVARKVSADSIAYSLAAQDVTLTYAGGGGGGPAAYTAAHHSRRIRAERMSFRI